MASKETKVIYGVKEYVDKKDNKAKKHYWTRIGTGFVNGDGSVNLQFDYFPADRSMTIQLRDPRSEEDKG